MPVTVNANMMTVSHKGSNGISTAFPDVCKTPSPAGPIPIPYPNIAMSSDTTSGSSTVKMDGNEIMIKGANMKMSTGDEAGAAMGVVSNKIKGKAEFMNYSFDVKCDGANVCRLADPTQQNMGSMNILGPVHVQPPAPVLAKQLEGCDATAKKKEKQASSKKTGWEKSGIDEAHKAPIQAVCDEFGVIIYFRSSNKYCASRGWISGKHKPKPHECLAAKTIAEGNVKDTVAWMRGRYHRQNWKAPPALPLEAATLFGVVMSLEGDRLGEPLKGYGMDSNGYSYKGKWITGDYDLQDIVYEGGDCKRPNQDYEWQFGRIKHALNKGMGWDGIQHGPQSQWKEKLENGITVDMPTATAAWLAAPAGTPVGQVQITETRKLAVMDKDLTIVAPNGNVIGLDSQEDAKNALICCGCGGG